MRRLALALLLASWPAQADMYQDASNAKLPEALGNLGIQTPAACDGKIGPNGAITGGSAAFTSATAGFAAADIGKRITIAGAGAAQHLNTATLIGGGAGHTVGQVIPITGGTGTAGSIEVRQVSGGVATEIGQANLGAYTTPPANPVSAGDITFTATWLRDAHVTTIASVTSATSATLAANAGATVSGARWGYGSDYAAEINAALAANSRAALPKGICGVASTVLLGNANSLSGVTHRQTTLMWLGPSRGGPVVKTSAAGMQIWLGGRFADIAVEGLGSADTCIDLHGINSWRIEEILSQNCVTTGMVLEPEVLGSVIDNIFYGVLLDAGGSTTASSMPLRFGNRNPGANPEGASNIGYNRFYDLRIFVNNQTGLQCGYADNNHFYGVWFWQYQTGTAKRMMDFQSDTNPAQCQGMTFYGLTLAPENALGNIVSRGGSAPSRLIVIYGYNNGAGVPYPTIEPGASLLCKSMHGDDNLCTPKAFGSFGGGNKSVTDTAAYRMFGVGTVFKPGGGAGRLTFTISGTLSNSTAGAGGLVTMRYGLGAVPPVNMATDTGTGCGSFPVLANTPSATFKTPFSTTCNVVGLSNGQTYWFDLAGKATVGGTLTVENVAATYAEAP